MAFDNRDSIDFGKEKIPKLFNSLFFPMLVGMVFDVTFILADGIFVGHGMGPDGLASVNLAAPIMLLMTGFGIMFGVGSSVVAAIHLAKENVKAARLNISQAFEACVVIGVPIAVILYLFPEPVLRLLGTSTALMPLVKEYLVWFIPTCLLLMLQLVGEFVIRLDGSPKYAMFANIIPALVNIALDYLFIFPCGMGLRGAALATTIGTGIGAAMVAYYMLRKAKTLKFYKPKFTRVSIRLALRNIGYMAQVGFSGFLGEISSSAMALCGNIAFGKYVGDSGIAAFSVICYLLPVLFNVFYSVASSSQPIISFNYGAEIKDRVDGTFRFTFVIDVAFGLFVTLVAALLSPIIVSAFLSPGSEAFSMACQGLPLFSISFLFIGINICHIGFFQSTEQNLKATLLVASRGIVFLITGFWLLPQFLGQTGLWLAVPFAELLTTTVAIVFRFRNQS